jgi:hypothetical protein
LGNAKNHGSHPRGQRSFPNAVPVSGPFFRAFMPVGSQMFRHLGFQDLVQNGFHPLFESVSSLGQKI